MANDKFEGRVTLLFTGSMSEIQMNISEVLEDWDGDVENIYVSPKYEEPDA